MLPVTRMAQMPDPLRRNEAGRLEREPAGGTSGVFLCADDFAMTNGISRAIVELAEAGRLSGASAMTTSAHWPAHATWLARARGQISAGLHLNLTLGAPRGAMPAFAPERRLPGIGLVTGLALRGGLPRAEVTAEIERQLSAFEDEIGFPPDHIDGHQHVHALPGLRALLLEVLVRRYPSGRMRPLLRNPTDTPSRIVRRGRARVKAMTLAWLSRGFSSAARAAGFACNDGFAGVTDFAPPFVGADFAAACLHEGPRHMVMCHPGFVDEELCRIDPVTERRQKEFDTLMGSRFPSAIWRPQRSATGDPLVWPQAWLATP